jgi:hypothetical protein
MEVALQGYRYQQQPQSNISSSGSSHQGVHISKENGMSGAGDGNAGNNLRLAGSGSGSESASDHNGHILGQGSNGHIAVGQNFGSDQQVTNIGQLNRPHPAGLRAVPPPVITTSTILSHDSIGSRPSQPHHPQAIFQAQ